MARKDRTPAPPKRPQGPQRRSTASAPRSAEQKRLFLLVGAGALVVLAAVLAFVLLGGGGSDDEAAVLADNGCTLKEFAGQPGTHVDSLTAKSDPAWNSNPPTSGQHFDAPAVWGEYSEPVPLIQSVHNLEHGGIVIHYGKDVPEAQLEELRQWYRDDPNALLVAPLDSLGSKLALSAWTAPARVGGSPDDGKGYLATCDAFNEKAFDTFKKTHRGEGPERFPVDALTPGT